MRQHAACTTSIWRLVTVLGTIVAFLTPPLAKTLYAGLIPRTFNLLVAATFKARAILALADAITTKQTSALAVAAVRFIIIAIREDPENRQ